MAAETWLWEERGRTAAPFWRNARTLAVDVAEPLIRLAQIPGAFVPGLDRALDKASGLTALFGADLNISPLDGPAAFAPLDGVPPPVVSKDGEGPVFFDGVETTITVAHNGRGTEQILLERIDLCVIAHAPGADSYFAYSLEGEGIIGAGFIEPLRFYVEVGANGARPARRQMTRPEGGKAMLVARGPNFLDTEPPGFYAIGPGELPVMLKLTVTALDTGYYETCFRFFYRVAARELRQYTSDPIRLYTDGA